MFYIYVYRERERYILGTKRCRVVKVKWELSSFHSGREKVCATGTINLEAKLDMFWKIFWALSVGVLTKNQMLNVSSEKKKTWEKVPLKAFCTTTSSPDEKKKTFLSPLINYNGISKSRRFVSTYFTVFQKCPFLEPLNQRGIWIESSVVFATEEDGLRPKTRGKYRKQSNPGNRWCSVCQTAPTTTVSYKQRPLSWFG